MPKVRQPEPRFLNLELRELETVMVLSEELHFGRTAERMMVSTAWVSHAVRAFERRIGAKIFDRTSRRVGLTATGEILVKELDSALDTLYRTLSRPGDHGSGVGRRLRIGHLMCVAEVPEFVDLVTAFEERFPDHRVHRLRFDSLTYFRALERGEVDLWVTWWPGAFPLATGLRAGPPIATRAAAVLVNGRHPLAGCDSIGLDDLTDHAVLDVPPGEPQLFRKWWLPRVAPNGRPVATMEASWTAGTFDELVHILSERSCAWLTRSTRLAKLPVSLTSVPVRDAPPFSLVPVWRAENENGAISAFVSMIASDCPTTFRECERTGPGR